MITKVRIDNLEKKLSENRHKQIFMIGSWEKEYQKRIEKIEKENPKAHIILVEEEDISKLDIDL